MTDIQRLFQEDPEKLTREDLKEMVAHYRNQRNVFNLEGKATKAKKTTPTTIDLDALLGDL